MIRPTVQRGRNRDARGTDGAADPCLSSKHGAFGDPVGRAEPLAALLLLLARLPGRGGAVTVDFESGAAPNEQVTSQYCCPGGVDKGPTFLRGTAAGFNAGTQPGLSGLSCDPPFLDASDQAHSGTRAISLIGCATGESTHSAAFFKLNWPTDSVEFQVGLAAETPSSCPNFICAEIWTTAFRADRSIVMQQQTLLGPNTKFKGVPLISGAEDIAYVAIERGTKETPIDSATGVMLAPLVGRLRLPGRRRPHLRPAVLAAGKQLPARRLAGDHPPAAGDEIAADQNPGHLDRQPEPLGSPGLAGTHRRRRGSPGPSRRTRPPAAQSTLVLEAGKSAEPGKYTVTVDGYVDKGEPSEKHSSVQIPVEITEPFILDPLGNYPVSRCTPVEVPIRIAEGPGDHRPDPGRRPPQRPASRSSSAPRPDRSSTHTTSARPSISPATKRSWR